MNDFKNLDDVISFLKKSLENVKSGDNVCIIHHDDADGCTSAAMLSILLFKNMSQFPETIPMKAPANVSKNFINKLKSMNPDHIFTLDVSIDPKKLALFNGFILDHHIQNFQDKGNINYINPRCFEKIDEKVPPTSFIIYKVFKLFYPNEKISWIAGIGITEDHRVELCKEVFYQVMKDYPNFFSANEITQESIERSIFGKLWDVVRSGRMIKKNEGARIAVQALIECKDDPISFSKGLTPNSYTLIKFYEIVNKTVKRILDDAPKKARFYYDKKILIYELPSSKIESLTSFVSDKLRIMYPEWVVCVISNGSDDKNLKLSIRVEHTRRDVNLAEIVDKLKKDFHELKGGGHKSAVGVNIKKEYLESFLKKFIDSF